MVILRVFVVIFFDFPTWSLQTEYLAQSLCLISSFSNLSMYVLHDNKQQQTQMDLKSGAFKAYESSKNKIDYSPSKTLIVPRFVSPHIMKTKQHIKSALDFSAICWCCEWICSLNRAHVSVVSLSHSEDGGGPSLVSSLSPSNWNEACRGCWGVAAWRSGHCSFCLADYQGRGALEGIIKSDEQE